MQDIKKLLQEYLKQAKVMQLATSVNNQPWVCNVHFYSDEDLNFYWCSLSTRRHSQEIEQNPQVAVAIKIHEDTQTEHYVIGIAVEGKAEVLTDEEIKKIGQLYINKLDKDPKLVEDILTGKTHNKFYRLTPTHSVLFDTKNFPDNPRQEYTIE